MKLGKESQALKTLHHILTSKRYKTWQPTHEKIMETYIELAVSLRKNVKDAFVQYRIICHQQNIPSLKDVLEKYRKMAEDKADEAQDRASKVTSESITITDSLNEISELGKGGLLPIVCICLRSCVCICIRMCVCGVWVG